MNDKYSSAKCAHYGRRLAARLCDQYFAADPAAVLDGPALRDFAPLRQINLLVIKQLLGEWQSESRRLRSAYFDFEAQPVQAALTQFMNVLSRHICLARAAFEPLLARAIADALGLVATPTVAFEHIFLPADGDGPVPAAALRENLRYLDLDKDFYDGFLDALPADGLPRPDLLERLTLYRTANYKLHQPVQRLVSELSNLLPLTTADLLEDGPVATPSSAGLSPAPTAGPTTVETPAVAGPIATAEPTAAAPVAPPLVAIQPPAPTSAAPTVAPPAPSAPPAVAAAAVPLYEKLKATQSQSPGLAQTLRESTTPAPGITERTAPKIETLREAISINQRFSFINELFNGENLDYHAAIQHLDALPTAAQAHAYITEHLAQRHDWSRKEEHVGKLTKLVERKFSGN